MVMNLCRHLVNFFGIIFLCILLFGCQHTRREVVADDIVGEQVRIIMEGISEDISQMRRMTEPSRADIKAYEVPRGSLSKLITIKWSGDIEKVVNTIADSIGFGYLMVGKRPLRTVYVNIDVIDVPAFRVLQSIGLQAGEGAGIVINDRLKQIRVAYLQGE